MLFPAVCTVLLFTVALTHSSLGAAVLTKRQSGFGEHKPQIWSGPYPCFDKDDKMKFPPPKDPPWFTDDKCHISICAGAMVITKSLCVLKGIVCPPALSGVDNTFRGGGDAIGFWATSFPGRFSREKVKSCSWNKVAELGFSQSQADFRAILRKPGFIFGGSSQAVLSSRLLHLQTIRAA